MKRTLTVHIKYTSHGRSDALRFLSSQKIISNLCQSKQN